MITATGREQRVIHVGLQTRTQAEVVDGLKEGEKLAVTRPAGAATGQPVKPITRSGAPAMRRA